MRWRHCMKCTGRAELVWDATWLNALCYIIRGVPRNSRPMFANDALRMLGRAHISLWLKFRIAADASSRRQPPCGVTVSSPGQRAPPAIRDVTFDIQPVTSPKRSNMILGRPGADPGIAQLYT